jgi:hypothetical protein
MTHIAALGKTNTFVLYELLWYAKLLCIGKQHVLL